MATRDCKHGQLKRQCPLCEASEDIKEAFLEGHRAGFYRGNRSDPMYLKGEEDYETSDAKVNSEAI